MKICKQTDHILKNFSISRSHCPLLQQANQCYNHQLSDALNVAVSINFKLKEKLNHDDLSLDIESRGPYNESEEVCEIIDSFLSFLTKYGEENSQYVIPDVKSQIKSFKLKINK